MFNSFFKFSLKSINVSDARICGMGFWVNFNGFFVEKESLIYLSGFFEKMSLKLKSFLISLVIC